MKIKFNSNPFVYSKPIAFSRKYKIFVELVINEQDTTTTDETQRKIQQKERALIIAVITRIINAIASTFPSYVYNAAFQRARAFRAPLQKPCCAMIIAFYRYSIFYIFSQNHKGMVRFDRFSVVL